MSSNNNIENQNINIIKKNFEKIINIINNDCIKNTQYSLIEKDYIIKSRWHWPIKIYRSPINIISINETIKFICEIFIDSGKQSPFEKYFIFSIKDKLFYVKTTELKLKYTIYYVDSSSIEDLIQYIYYKSYGYEFWKDINLPVMKMKIEKI